MTGSARVRVDDYECQLGVRPDSRNLTGGRLRITVAVALPVGSTVC